MTRSTDMSAVAEFVSAAVFDENTDTGYVQTVNTGTLSIAGSGDNTWT